MWLNIFYLASGGCPNYCDERVCLSLCLYVSPLMYLKNHTSPNFLYRLTVAVVRYCSDDILQ